MRTAPLALAVAAALLGWVLYAETGTEPQAVPVGSGALRPAGIARPVDVAPKPEQVAGLVSTILERPLFSMNRRPTAAVPAQAGKEPRSQATPRLAGVLVSAGARGAIFAQVGEKPVLAREGDRVGPYTVQSISAGQVTVIGPHGLTVLHPAFADAPESGGRGQSEVTKPAPKSLLDRLRAAPPPKPPVPTPEMLREVFKRQTTEPPR